LDGKHSFKNQYPYLYRIAHHKNAMVASMFSTVPLNISFRWSLLGDNLQLWHNLVAKIPHVTLNENEDLFKWGLNHNESFNVRSITGNLWENKLLWKIKLPLKIEIFLWYLNKGVTKKDNLT
jgi:hypothetical protein